MQIIIGDIIGGGNSTGIQPPILLGSTTIFWGSTTITFNN